MKKPIILIVFGTRPEAIKMAPIVKVFQKDPSFVTKVILTAQHREMLDQVLHIFSIQGDYDFNLMQTKQTLESITTGVMQHLSPIILQEKPDLILVHGDTSTTFATSLAAFYQSIPIGHVEAGLRSMDMQNPFPEEMNRTLTDTLTTLFFCPTHHACENIRKEKPNAPFVYITGNTVVDSLLWVLGYIEKQEPTLLTVSQPTRKTILATMHRRESWGQPIENICRALRDIVIENEDVEIVFPMHKNPIVRESVYPYLQNMDRVQLIEPLDYIHFVAAMKKSYIIVTDSGGIQEEAPTFGKPVLLTRGVTERPEGIQCGVVKIVGTDYSIIRTELTRLLCDQSYYNTMSWSENPFGDGHAAERIHASVRDYFQLSPPDIVWDGFTK